MKAADADVIWIPARTLEETLDSANRVRVEMHGSGWTRASGDLWMPAAKAWDFVQHPTDLDAPEMHTLSIFVLFNTLVIRDHIDPQAVHNAFLKIDEYRDTISPDIPTNQGEMA